MNKWLISLQVMFMQNQILVSFQQAMTMLASYGWWICHQLHQSSHHANKNGCHLRRPLKKFQHHWVPCWNHLLKSLILLLKMISPHYILMHLLRATKNKESWSSFLNWHALPPWKAEMVHQHDFSTWEVHWMDHMLAASGNHPVLHWQLNNKILIICLKLRKCSSRPNHAYNEITPFIPQTIAISLHSRYCLDTFSNFGIYVKKMLSWWLFSFNRLIVVKIIRHWEILCKDIIVIFLQYSKETVTWSMNIS